MQWSSPGNAWLPLNLFTLRLRLTSAGKAVKTNPLRMVPVLSLLFMVARMPALPAADVDAADPLKSATERIEKIRKAPVSIEVRDKFGRKIPGAIVRVEQIRHEFLFGCNVFILYKLTGEAHQAYANRFSALFNYATLPFYWGTYEPERGRTQREQLRQIAQWCKAYGISTKGHPLVWHEVYPKWAPTDAAEVRAAYRRRIQEIVPDFKGLVDRWDVVNEATVATKFKSGESQWVLRDGPARVVEDALAWAHAANPEAELVYNDYNLGADHQALIAQLIKDGAPFSVIGLQSHMHAGEWSLAEVWKTCETYAAFGKKLHFTEVSVVSGEHGWERPLPWESTPEGEQRQAEYVEKFYTLLFSHPAVGAITWWDLPDGQWQGAPSGLLHKDLSPKPAYERLQKLVRRTWWTRASLVSDAAGRCEFTGFRGDYQVTVQAGGKTRTASFSLGKAGDTWVIKI